LADVYIDELGEGARLTLNVDREKAEAMGVSFDEINQTLSVATGSNYVNDYTNNGRVQQVIVQADAPHRMQPEQLLTLSVRNRLGQMLPLSTFATLSWNVAPQQLNRYQGYPAIRITGSAAQGSLPAPQWRQWKNWRATYRQGLLEKWAGSSLQEKASASQLPGLIVLSMLVVFMVLAALYESWSVPFAVMFVVPLGLLGAVLAVTVANMTNDVFFKVGLITLIGLSAKNAILIIEFARQLIAEGKTLLEATLTASKQRLRPILMTSLAFTLGVVPLMLASGASDSTQHAIGTGVFGGMISATLLAVFFVPVFFVVITRFTGMRKRRHKNNRND
jgi:multidrug efflux pump